MTASVHAIVLVAGRSSRSGAGHKLMATFDGEPLARRSARVALASRAAGVSVVVGHRAAKVRAAVRGLAVRIVENPAHADGLSTSLTAGISATPAGMDGFLVMLADQPLLEAEHLNRLIDAFVPDGLGSIVVATDDGVHGNPVVISKAYIEEIMRLRGDVGARKVIAAHRELVRTVEIGRAASFDVDTEAAIRAAGGIPEA